MGLFILRQILITISQKLQVAEFSKLGSKLVLWYHLDTRYCKFLVIKMLNLLDFSVQGHNFFF